MSLIARVRLAMRALAIGGYLLVVEWVRALVVHTPNAAAPALLLGGIALALPAILFSRERLGLSDRLWGQRIIGGFALGAVLLLPAAVRPGAPLLPLSLAIPAMAVAIGQELAFRGALYAALEELSGAPLAVVGSTILWTAAHAFSHPLQFLVVVAAAGLLLGLWRWRLGDLVAPIIGHVIADLAI